MTLHPDEQARELFYELKPECQAHADGCKGCAEAIALIAALLARVRQQALEEAAQAFEEEYCKHDDPLLGTIRGLKAIREAKKVRQAVGEETK